MARDVAERELDQAGFPISNLGTPTAPGSATKTDNATVPLPNAGAGAPGASLLAAPADHVHPAAAGAASFSATFADVSEQATTGVAETVLAQFPVDFVGAPRELVPTLAALVDVDAGNATVNLRLSTAPDVVDGAILAIITKAATGAPELKTAAGEPFPPLATPGILKITAFADSPAGTCRVRAKTIALRG